jgi:hypothetical protein
MEKTEYLEQEAPAEVEPSGGKINIQSKFSAVANWLFGFTKFIFGVCLLPFVYGVTSALLKELDLIDATARGYLWAGVAALIIIHLLIWEPAIIYAKGHKILEVVFKFFKPLVKVAPYLLPIYTIVLFLSYLLLSATMKTPDLMYYFTFLFSFSTTMHLVFSAKTLRSKKGDFLKGNYIFGFSFVYIMNLIILSFFLSVIFDKFSFVDFFNQTFQIATKVFGIVFRQLFL